MRFLHTADWHVGKAIFGRSRIDEYAAVLHEVVAIARDQSVDAVLVAGDLYEHRAPQPEADRLVLETLLELHDAGIPVVAITGNHDSPARFGALAPLLREIDVHVVPRVVPPEEGGVITLASRDGTETLVVACVPFVAPRRFGEAASLFAGSEKWFIAYADGMGDLMCAMARAFRVDAVNVLLGHLFTDGALAGGGEHPVTIGADYAVPPGRLPATASYIALGHVHEAQSVKGAPGATRYSGSLLQLDFGEGEQQKSVFVVEASAGRPAQVQAVPLTCGRKLVTLHAAFDELAPLASSERVQTAFLRVFLKVDAPAPGLVDRVRELLPDAIRIQLEYEHPESTEAAGASVATLKPREQFVAYYRRVHGDPTPAILAAFDELLILEHEAE